MPRTLFCLRCIHATWVADVHVTYQASTKSLVTFKHFPTRQQGLTVDIEKSVLKVRSERWQPASCRHLFWTICTSSVSKWVQRDENSQAPYLKPDLWLVKANGLEAMDHPLNSNDLPRGDFQLFGPAKKHRLERDLQQTPAWNTPPSPA
jgi:hypothetical protein